ncbi:MAG: pilus assembly protein [Deltaproteobacteria bacterium]|nr:pilus assembly protein [Deltaproteobacteria bacterium]
MRTKLSSQKGASAVEFALVLPMLMVISFGIIEFGAYLYNQQVITNASREGARAGIVASGPRVDLTTIAAVVNNYAKGHLITFGPANNPAINVTGYAAAAAFSTPLTVQVTYNYSFLVIPDLIADFTRLRPMQASSVMRYE